MDNATEKDTKELPVPPVQQSSAHQEDGTQQVGWGIDKGQVRESNEDSLAAITLNQANDGGAQTIGVYAVADGMGGHAGGEVASKIAIRTAVHKLVADATQVEGEMPDDYRPWLESAVKLAHDMVKQRAEFTQQDMGTTLVMAVMVGKEVHIANVGDSRAYIISSEGIRRVTHDHSYVQALVDHGTISPAEAINHPYRNVLTQAVGIQDDVQIDVFDETLDEDTSLLLCSDGLWDMLGEQEIYRIVRGAATPGEACQALIDQSNAAGGKDNIAAVLVRLAPTEKPAATAPLASSLEDTEPVPLKPAQV